jgi:hypothetical protein
MADQAATGYYHDFLSPLSTPELQLCDDLAVAAACNPAEKTDDILALRKRVINGDFDASTEEGDAWAASPEGRATFARLVRR